MRVGELSRRSGVSVASIKYYLREGLLAPGERTSPNQAAYGEAHLRRLRMIRALIDVGGLSVVATRGVLAAVDDPDLPLHEALGRASGTTTTAPDPAQEQDEAWTAAERMLAERVAERGWQVSDENPAWHTAVDVLATYARLGDADLAAQLGLYMRVMEEVAEREVAVVVDRGDRARTLEGVVVGTVLGDTLLAAVRRLAQQDCSLRLLGGDTDPAPGLASAIVTSTQARPAIDFPSRIGIWWTSDAWTIGAAREVARDIERMGYGSLFYGEAYGKETLTQAAAFLGATDRLVVGTGIANIHARDPIAAESGARTLTALYPGRFVLGLGISHGPLVERGRGGTYTKPLATTRDYLERMDAVPEQVEPGARPVRLLAALGPKMIELSGSAADGAHPYLVLPAQTAVTREALGPDKWVVSEQAVAITGVDGATEEDALRRAHAHLEIYSGLPNYRNSWVRQGFDESDLVRGGSDRLARAVVGIGDATTAARSLQAHLDAGADHVVVQVLGDSPSDDPRPALEELAGSLM